MRPMEAWSARLLGSGTGLTVPAGPRLLCALRHRNNNAGTKDECHPGRRTGPDRLRQLGEERGMDREWNGK